MPGERNRFVTSLREGVVAALVVVLSLGLAIGGGWLSEQRLRNLERRIERLELKP